VVWGLPVLPRNREAPRAPHRAPEPVPDHRLQGVTAVTNQITHFRLTASVHTRSRGYERRGSKHLIEASERANFLSRNSNHGGEG
jgi:hypothetical protein